MTVSLDPAGRACTVALLMMPFGPSDRPSLGLSLLAQCLNDAGVPARTFYPNLDFERRIGSGLSQDFGYGLARAQAGDWLFSRFLDPVGAPEDFLEAMARRRVGRKAAFAEFARVLPDLLAHAQALLDDWVAAIGRLRPRVVGLSSCYQQHLACLAIARRIKEASPATLVVLGGTNCNEPIGGETFRRFPFLDAVVSGPGEIAFVDLVRRHLAGERRIELPGVHFRPADGGGEIAPQAPVASEPNLDDLPMPSFDDFFAAWDEEPREADASLRPAIPIETSRGCWWGQKHHCVFCSENAHSMRYRAKSPDRVFAEFAWMLDRYPGSRICATDEILDLRLLETVMPRLAERGDERRIFFSVKANLRKPQLAQLAAAGVTSIQPGIESLRDEILEPMRKGVTGLQNIQLLKWCRELGIETVWGILYGFPFETSESYARMAELAPSLTHLSPPKLGSVSLQRYSPLFAQAGRFGIHDLRPHESYRWIYRADEEALARLAYRFDYSAARPVPEGDYTLALRHEVELWEGAAGGSHLFYLDDSAHLVIGDTRPAAVRRVHRLHGAARTAYLFCDQIRPRHAIARALAAAGHELDEAALARLLERLLADRLMLEDKGLYLSLAVRMGRNYLPPIAITAGVVAEGRAMGKALDAVA